jgi:predicted Zn-dependent protease
LTKHLKQNSLLAPAVAIQIAISLIALSTVPQAHAQAAATISTATSSALPNLGDGTDMTPPMERRLGDRIARVLYRDPDYVDDAVLMEYVQGIWQPLLVAARSRGELPPEQDEAYAWEILLGRDRSVNAFALPGAYFGLHLGLVGIVTSRDELASVMAHELSHATQRHISRMMTRQSQQAPWMLGALILGVLAASKDPSAANAVIMGSQAAAAQGQLNFSRDMEREADRVGFAISTQAGFAQQGFVTMFGKLQQASRLNDSGNFPYLRSHPLSTERMADMQSRIELPDAAAPALPTARKNVQETDHAMMAARARVLSNYTVDALRTWAVEVEPAHLAKATPAQQAASLYGATLAAIKLRDYKDGQTQWTRLSDSVRNDPVAARLARLLGVELRLAQADGAAALALLQSGAKPQDKSTRAELFLTAQAQLQQGVAGSTTVASAPGKGPASGLTAITQQLQTWVADHPRDAQAWQLLSSTYAAEGRTLSSIRAQAEVNVAQLDYPAALSRFKTAQEWARKGGAGTDHFEASIVDTRTRQVESTVREQALER